MGFKTNKCCCTAPPHYYTMRSHYANYFLPIWWNTCDGLPFDVPPPNAFEGEINEYGYTLLSAGYVNGTNIPNQGDVIISQRELDGTILAQSNPTDFPYATKSSGTLSLQLESSESLAWVISAVHDVFDVTNTTNPLIRCFDLSTFAQISDFTLSVTLPGLGSTRPYTMRAIDNTLVGVSRTTGVPNTAAVWARKFNTVGATIASITVSGLYAGKTVRSVVPYVSRHYRRDYETILVYVGFTDLTARFMEFDLSTFNKLGEGPDFSVPNIAGIGTNFVFSSDHYFKDHFDPTNNTAFLSRDEYFLRVDLDSLTVEYLNSYVEPTDGMAIAHTIRVYGERAYVAGMAATPTAPFTMVIDTATGLPVWFRGNDSGIGATARIPISAHIFSGKVLDGDRAYDIETGSELFQTPLANYATGQEQIFITNAKTIVAL